MVCDPFEFERYSAQHLCSGGNRYAAQALDRLTIRGCVPD